MVVQPKEGPGAEIRAMRLTHGLTQEDVARALDISLKTVGRLEKEGRGHNLRRVRNFLEGLRSESAKERTTGPSPIRAFIDQQAIPGAHPLALAFQELAALLENLPSEQRAPAVETFLDVQRRLDEGGLDPAKTLEAAVQVTVKAFSQFVGHAPAE